MFWLVVGGVLLVVLGLCWWHDRRRRGHVRVIGLNAPSDSNANNYGRIISNTNIHDGGPFDTPSSM